MDSEIANWKLDSILSEMRPTNWLTAFGHSEGIVKSDGLSRPLPKRTLRRLRSELILWNSAGRAISISQVTLTDAMATMSFAELKRDAMSLLPWNSLLLSLILAEPDSQPYQQGNAKIQVFSRLLHKELEKS